MTKIEFTKEEWYLISVCVRDKLINSEYKSIELKKLSDKIGEYRWLRFTQKVI